jgi:protease I
MKKALIIIAQNGFQDHELAGTRQGLIDGGYQITLASTAVGDCTGKFGSTERAEISLKGVDVSEYDKIAFIGGPGAGPLADDPDAIRVAKDAYAAGDIVLGAICIAPIILAKVGVLKGKKATVWNPSTGSGQANGEAVKTLIDHGATYTGDPVTVDGRIVTGNGPEAAEEFGHTLAAVKAK